MNNNSAQLWIPLDNGWCMIPRGLSEDDYNLLLETLALWKPKLVLPSKPEPDTPDSVNTKENGHD